MNTKNTPKDKDHPDFETIDVGRGPWANAWHPSWGDDEDQSGAKMRSGEDAPDTTTNKKESKHTDSPS